MKETKQLPSKEEAEKFTKKNIDLSTIYTPLTDNVVVEVVVPVTTKGGIFIPEQLRSQEKDKVAKVIATGKDVKNLKVGDMVMVGPGARPVFVPLVYGENDPIQHVQVREFDILGIVSKDYKLVTSPILAEA